MPSPYDIESPCIAGRLVRAVSPLPFDGATSGAASDDTYSYDSASNLTSVTTRVGSPVRSTTTHSYSADRLTQSVHVDVVDDTRDVTTAYGHNGFGDRNVTQIDRHGGNAPLDVESLQTVGSGSFVTQIGHDTNGSGAGGVENIGYVAR